MQGLAKATLVAATLLFLASIGGGMAVAMPFLLPLHWLAARHSEGIGYLGWVLLALASIWEAVYVYVLLTSAPWISVVGIVALGVILSTVFLITTDRRETGGTQATGNSYQA